MWHGTCLGHAQCDIAISGLAAPLIKRLRKQKTHFASGARDFPESREHAVFPLLCGVMRHRGVWELYRAVLCEIKEQLSRGSELAPRLLVDNLDLLVDHLADLDRFSYEITSCASRWMRPTRNMYFFPSRMNPFALHAD
jgi:hypothetical protein